MTAADTTLVFVYGTLKHCYRNHYLLERATFIGVARTRKHFCMMDGGFPVVMHPAHGHAAAPIAGELYAVTPTILARLDDLEGVDQRYPLNGMYRRETVQVLCAGRHMRAGIYVGNAHWWQSRRELCTTRNAAGCYEWEPRR